MRTRLIHSWFTLAVLILAHCSLIATAPAQVPLLIHYQGRLVDNGALVNSNVVMSLRLYPTETGGVSAYEDLATVAVVDGLYATTIGDNTRSGSLVNALTNTEVWVEVEVDGTLLSPRERLASVGFAVMAGGVTNDAITSAMIRNRSILFSDIAANGATRDQVMKLSALGVWVPGDDEDTVVSDHGALTGRADDDHTQYYRMDGARMLAGTMNAGNNKIANLGPATAADDALRYDQAVKLGDTAGGDLTGTYPDPSLAGNAVDSSTIQDGSIGFADIGQNSAADGQVMKWDGGTRRWGPGIDLDSGIKTGDAAGRDLTGTYPDPSLASNAVDSATIQDGAIGFVDIGPNGAGSGQVMKWNGSAWGAAEDVDTGVTDHGALTGLPDDDHPQYLRSDAADVFNEAGASVDLRLEGNSDPNLLFLDASADAVGIGELTPEGKLQVSGDEVRIGNAGTPDLATGDGDLYVEDFLEVDGSIDVGEDLDVADRLTVQGLALIWDDALIGGATTGFDGPAEALEIAAQSASWYVGVQNQSTEADSGFFIGKSNDPDGIFHIENNGSVGFGNGMTVGTNGSRFLEILEITGTTSTNGNTTLVSHPPGYDVSNTRILSASIHTTTTGDFSSRHYHGDNGTGLDVHQFRQFSDSFFVIDHPEPEFSGQAYSIIVMKMP